MRTLCIFYMHLGLYMIKVIFIISSTDSAILRFASRFRQELYRIIKYRLADLKCRLCHSFFMFCFHLLLILLLAILLEGQLEGGGVIFLIMVKGGPDGAVSYIVTEWVMWYALRCGVKLTRISSLKYNYGFPIN